MYKLRTVTVAVQFALAAMSGRAKAQVKRSCNVKNVRKGALAVAALFASAANAGEVSGSVAGLELMLNAWTSGGSQIDWSSQAGIQQLDLTSSLIVDPTTGDLRLADGVVTHYDSFTKGPGGTNAMVSIDLVPASFTGNVDPIIAYGMQVVNNGTNAVTFQKIVSSPILPTITSSPTIVRAGISGSAFDFAGNGVTVTPRPGAFAQDGDGTDEIQMFQVRRNVGSGAWLNAGVDVGGVQSFAGGGSAFTYTYPAVNLPFQAGPTGSFAQMRTVTRFSLTGGGDRATFTGFAEILPVPEPGEYALMLAGLAVVASVARRRRISLS